jgi:hypothetical protein
MKHFSRLSDGETCGVRTFVILDGDFLRVERVLEFWGQAMIANQDNQF